MRAYRMVDWAAQPRSVEVPAPSPGPGEILVRVAGCGLCRSDLSMPQLPQAIGARMGWRMPFTLGHETAGWVAGFGAGVTGASAGFAEGDAVALVSPTSCGTCQHCLRGQDNCCPAGATGRGYGRDGGLADYVLVDSARALLPLGDLDPRTAGPLTDAGATAYHAVQRALPRIVPGGTVAVVGAGGLGAFAVQFLRALTAARVVAVDTNPDRLAYATDVGAHETRSAMDGLRSLDAVLDFVGTDATIAAGVAAVRAGGAFGLVGSAGGRLEKGWFGALPRDGEVYTFQGSTIADARDVVALATAGQVRVEVEQYPFDEVAAAYAAVAAGTLKSRAVVLLS
ncbi:alcohol dehydrogenase catalytic domain-containing protein [Micromonospora sp. CPCC 206061]|uniref:alcohol dehydrogenase catalytic domain-containing protein n=1 Tax=Micromonospora sp. CPCC 206061 TaxID=3122410 RepID=UPI002FF2910D